MELKTDSPSSELLDAAVALYNKECRDISGVLQGPLAKTNNQNLAPGGGVNCRDSQNKIVGKNNG
jgi:hypothetical protein